MLDILTVLDNITIWHDNFWLEFFQIMFKFCRKNVSCENCIYMSVTAQQYCCWRATFCCIMVCLVLDWIDIWNTNVWLIWQMCFPNFAIWIGLGRVDKNVLRIISTVSQVLYRNWHEDSFLFSKVSIRYLEQEIIQKPSCDTRDEHIQVLSSQYLWKCSTV
jgi:hypothetical protein